MVNGWLPLKAEGRGFQRGLSPVSPCSDSTQSQLHVVGICLHVYVLKGDWIQLQEKVNSWLCHRFWIDDVSLS